MANQNSLHVSDETLAALQAQAELQGKSVDEVIEDAAQRYLAHKVLDRLNLYGRAKARELGIKESDVQRLIDEIRSAPEHGR